MALVACGGHSSRLTYRVGGSISGLSATGLVLQNNGGDSLTIAANAASFQFVVSKNGNYNVTVASQPTGQTCTVSNGVGNDIKAPISNIHIACGAVTFTVGGTISGLTGSGLVLQNNSGDNLTIAANASTFEFATSVAYGGAYAITVLTQPSGQWCAIANASSTALSQVTNIAVTCGNAQFIRFSGHNMIISEEQIAKDSGGVSPLYFVFVNNTSVQSPDGSYEHPYPTLALANANSAPNNIIYVFPGDGTTVGMDAGIVLQAEQKLWGASVSHVIPTNRGEVTIPIEASTAPTITNTAGNGITLAINNDVSGFIVSNVFYNGIFGSNPADVKISSSTLDGSQMDQIHLDYNASSPGSVALDNLTVTNGALNAIVIGSTSSAAMNFTLNNSVIQGTAALSMDISFTSQANVQLTNNTFENNISSNHLLFDGPATLIVSGNNLINNTSVSDVPLIVTAGAVPLSATIASNTISGNTTGAVRFILNDTESTLSLTSNTIANNGTGSQGLLLGSAIFIYPNNTSAGNCDLVLSNNTFSGNAGSALVGYGGGFDNFQATASGNSITGNGGGGLVFATTANTFTLAAIDNTISGGGDNGVMTTSVTMSTAHMALTHNRIIGNTNSTGGIAITHTGTNLQLVVTDNEISGNDSSGILVYPSSPINNIVASIKNNTIDSNQNLGSNASSGVDLEQFTNLSIDLNDNTFSNNVGSDVFIGSTDTSPSACLAMTGNNSSMGYIFSSGTGVFNLAPTDVMSVNSGAITAIGSLTPVASCP